MVANYNTLKGLMLAAAATDSDNDGLPDAWRNSCSAASGQDRTTTSATRTARPTGRRFAHCSDPDDPALPAYSPLVWAEDAAAPNMPSIPLRPAAGEFPQLRHRGLAQFGTGQRARRHRARAGLVEQQLRRHRRGGGPLLPDASYHGNSAPRSSGFLQRRRFPP
ncbi:MAG: hypothetical protein R3F11_08560 [Verrucomicrobiales bacterium]